MALKMSSKTAGMIKKMLQNYAIARPAVRLSLKFLKGKNDAGSWVYGPTTKATVADAAYKVAGPDVAAQCIVKLWPSEDAAEKGAGLMISIVEGENTSDYKLVAYLPNSKAGAYISQIGTPIITEKSDFQRASRAGQYISIDGRPVSISKGLPRDIVKSFKSHLRSLGTREGSEATFSGTFFCLHIYCPEGSYDVNIEPSKDEVLFENPRAMLSLADALFSDVYGEITTDGKSEKRNAKQLAEKSSQGNAFDVLLAKRPTPIRPTSELQRPSAVECAVAQEVSRPRRYSHRPDVDNSVTAYEECAIPATPWTVAKRNIAIRSLDDRPANISPRRQQQLPTPARERPSPLRQSPTKETLRPSFHSSRTHAQPSRVSYSSPEATPLATKGARPGNLISSANSHPVNQESEPARRGYGDEAIATWVRDSGQYVDDSQPFNDVLSNNGEVTRETTASEPGRDDISSLGRTCEKPAVTGLAKPFRLPLRRSQQLQQSTVASERDDTAQPTGNAEENPTEDNEPPQPEYPGFERVSTLIRDPSKEAFPAQSGATLDHESRKKTVNQRMKKQQRSVPTLHVPNTNASQDSILFSRGSNGSPHKNRYLAAKAALATRELEQHREQENGKTEVHSVELEHDDPRAYYIRNRDTIQESTRTKSGLRIRRTRTQKLPLERIPDDCKLYHLISTCSMELKALSSLTNDFRKVDTYIRSGAIESSGCGFTELSQKDYADWEHNLRNLLQQKYRADDENIQADVTIDFKLPDGETYGFV